MDEIVAVEMDPTGLHIWCGGHSGVRTGLPWRHRVSIWLPTQETHDMQVQSLGQKDPRSRR